MEDILFRAMQYQNLSIKKAQAHYRAAEYFTRRHIWLGTPVTVASSVVATSIFATIGKTAQNTAVLLVTGTVSIGAAVLSGLQTFLRYSDVASAHRRSGVLYEGARRQLDLFALEFKQDSGREAAIKALADIVAKLDAIAESEPTVPEGIYASVKWKEASPLEFSPSTNLSVSTAEPVAVQEKI